MNELQYQEEQQAWFARSDRFEGFDRGDADNDRAEMLRDAAERAAREPVFDDGSDDIPY